MADGMLRGSLDGVDREALYKAVRAGLKNEDGRARGQSQFRLPEPLRPRDQAAAARHSPGDHRTGPEW